MELVLLPILSPTLLAQSRTRQYKFYKVHTLLTPMVVVYSVKVLRLTSLHTYSLLIVEKILGKIFITNHNIILLMLQVRWFQHMLPSRTTRGKIGMMIEHMSLMEQMAILLEKQSDGSLMDQTSLSFKI